MKYSTFYDLFKNFSWNEIKNKIYSCDHNSVEAALRKNSRLDISDLIALLSPAAADYLDMMKEKSSLLTRKRFGNTIQMFSPMYVSNECQNICTYCGFSLSNKIPRLTLSMSEVKEEIKIIKSMGFKHILIVSGEAHKTVGMDYFIKLLNILKSEFANISFEVQPLEMHEYQMLMQHGLYAVLVYQETYNEKNYKIHHPKGKKSNFRWRLETPDRLGRAGIHKIGLGSLIGLEDWRTEAWHTALHLAYLRKKYWMTRFSISFPRLRPAEGLIEPKVNISDQELVQLICAFRIFDENVELSLSTREPAALRDQLAQLGITTMSAASKTEPGGYASSKNALKQFEIDDSRSVDEIVKKLSSLGLEAVWKDWDNSFNSYGTQQNRA